MNREISWRECNIHNKNIDIVGSVDIEIAESSTCETSKLQNKVDEIEQQQHQDDAEESQQCKDETDNADEFEFYHLLFPPTEEKSFETFEYDLSPLSLLSPSPSLSVLAAAGNKIKLRGHSEINNSTGLSMWLGAEELSQYLLDSQNVELIRGKKVLELGSGLGLCGIICHYLGAEQVLMTDGDSDVLSNLRANVRQNIDSSFCDETILAEQQDDDEHLSNGGVGQKIDEVCIDDNNHDGSNEQHNNKLPIVSCPQHIWGKAIDEFRECYGTSDVILAADCLYITQSLEPFWQSIDQLLVPGRDDATCRDDDGIHKDRQAGDGIVIYIMKSSSAAPVDMVLGMAEKYGFTWTTATGPSCDNDKISESIFIFRRK